MILLDGFKYIFNSPWPVLSAAFACWCAERASLDYPGPLNAHILTPRASIAVAANGSSADLNIVSMGLGPVIPQLLARRG